MQQYIKKINLIPRQYIRAQKIKKYKYIGSSILIVESVLFVILLVMPARVKLQKEQLSLNTLQMQLTETKYQEVAQVMSDLEKAQVELQIWQEKYNALKKPNFVSVRELDTITAHVPNGLIIGLMKLAPSEEAVGGVIYLEGIAMDYNTLFSYVTVLENTYGNAHISFTTEQKESEEGKYQYYTITIPIGEVLEEAEIEEEMLEE